MREYLKKNMAEMSSFQLILQRKGHFIGCCWGLGCTCSEAEEAEAEASLGAVASSCKSLPCTAMLVSTRASTIVSLLKQLNPKKR